MPYTHDDLISSVTLTMLRTIDEITGSMKLNRSIQDLCYVGWWIADVWSRAMTKELGLFHLRTVGRPPVGTTRFKRRARAR
jgi:hypothetical protein